MNQIKLISKPIELNLCSLVYAVVTDNLEDIALNSHYIVHDAYGIQYVIYARNDQVFYEKLCDGTLDHCIQSS